MTDEEKVLSSTVVRQELAAEGTESELIEGRTVGRKEQFYMHEGCTGLHATAKSAFKNALMFLMYSLKNKILVINSIG